MVTSVRRQKLDGTGINDDLVEQVTSITVKKDGRRVFTSRELADKAVFVDAFETLRRPATMDTMRERVEATAKAIAEAELAEWGLKQGMDGFPYYLRGMQSNVMKAPDVVLEVMRSQEDMSQKDVGETYKALRKEAFERTPVFETVGDIGRVEERLSDIRAVMDFASLRTDSQIEQTLEEANAIHLGWAAFERKARAMIRERGPGGNIVDGAVSAAREIMTDNVADPDHGTNLWFKMILRDYQRKAQSVMFTEYQGSLEELPYTQRLRVFRQVFSENLRKRLTELGVPTENHAALDPMLLEAAQEADRPKGVLEKLSNLVRRSRRWLTGK